MCFRPAEISAKVECPDCGKKINPVAGVLPKKCPFCGGEGPFNLETMASAAASPSAPPASPVAPAPAAPQGPAPSARSCRITKSN